MNEKVYKALELLEEAAAEMGCNITVHTSDRGSDVDIHLDNGNMYHEGFGRFRKRELIFFNEEGKITGTEEYTEERKIAFENGAIVVGEEA